MGTRLGALTLVLLFACSDDAPAGPGPTPDAPATTRDAPPPDAPPSTIQTGTLITIDDGQLQGAADGMTRRFAGIPFAKPPVGALRWKPPEKNDSWSTVRDATMFGKRCAQTQSLQSDASTDEDCLYLNVWVPDPAPTAPLPVMLWLHGGGNTSGSASDNVPLIGGGLFYDGKGLAATYGVVVVSTNYRIGPLGFYYDPTVGAGGNQGLLDQRAAMQWVKDNIAVFGGDPGNVTIFGESAGSFDVCFHVAAPGSAGMFQRALGESGGCTTLTTRVADATASATAFRAGMGCDAAQDVTACMLGKTVPELLAAAPVIGGPATTLPGGDFYQGGTAAWSFGPVVDGTILPDQPRTLFDQGHVNKVPYIIGSNTDEGTLFHIGATPVANETELRAALGRRFGADTVDAIMTHYPVSDFASADDDLQRITGDVGLVCPTRDSALRAAAAGMTVRMYNFDFPLPIPNLGFLKATHGAEIAFVFDSVDTPEQATLGNSIRGYWTRFAKTGDPNGGSAVAWPAFSASSDMRVNLNTSVTTVSDFRADLCDFWGTIYDAQF